MRQTNIPEEMKVPVSYEEMSSFARQLQPTVFTDGKAYCCLLGDDPQSIFGWGETVQMAILDWETNLSKYMDGEPEEELMNDIRKKLKF